MATLTRTKIRQGGFVPKDTNMALVAAAGGGDDFPNDGETYLVVNNGDASPKTLTFDSLEPDPFTAADQDFQVTVAAGETHWIGPFDTGRFGSSVAVTYSAVTSVTVNPFTAAP